jgi:hypothetical protein
MGKIMIKWKKYERVRGEELKIDRTLSGNARTQHLPYLASFARVVLFDVIFTCQKNIMLQCTGGALLGPDWATARPTFLPKNS